MEIEAQVRVAIRDAVNRPSRKPFYWGGLKGYEQLEAIAQALGAVSSDHFSLISSGNRHRLPSMGPGIARGRSTVLTCCIATTFQACLRIT